MRARGGRLLLTATLALATGGCHWSEREPPAIARRLDPVTFGQPAASHTPVVQIGTDARPVIAAPAVHPIGKPRPREWPVACPHER